MPEFANPLSTQAILRLAARDDVESRLVVRERSGLTLEHGPFSARRIRALPRTRWTLLVQGLNLHVPAADELLRRFSFIPYARLDDIMVSYAVPGGGVGAHVDSYDVFLLQGMGRRRWQLSSQRDLRVRPHSPLRVLERFRAQVSYVLQPGDMLYLPPAVAHDGVALDECLTYSIGFRAPQALDIGREFLIYLEERLALKGRFEDPGRRAARRPGELPADLIRWAAQVVRGIRWNRDDIERFVGVHLSEPSATTVFEPPQRPLALSAFQRTAEAGGIRLDRRSIMLYRGNIFFINGDELRLDGTRDRTLMTALADNRQLRSGARLSARMAAVLYEHYRRGAVHPSGGRGVQC